VRGSERQDERLRITGGFVPKYSRAVLESKRP